MKKVKIALLVLAVLIFAGIAVKSRIESSLNELSETRIENVDLTSVPDGIYEGQCRVFPVEAKVSVTVKDHRIENIDLLEHKNGKGASAETLLQTVREKQTLEVDVVTGATYSSKAILKAIENALCLSAR